MADTPAARRWRALLEEHRNSGLTYHAFAESKGLNPSTFSWWRSHLRRLDAADGAGSKLDATAPTFTVLAVTPPPATLDVVLDRYEARVLVDHDTDLDLLRRLLGALA